MSRCCCPSARLKCCVRIGLFYFAQILCHWGQGAFRYEVSQRSPPFPPFLRFPFGGGRNGRLRVSLQSKAPGSSARSLSTPGTAALIAVDVAFRSARKGARTRHRQEAGKDASKQRVSSHRDAETGCLHSSFDSDDDFQSDQRQHLREHSLQLGTSARSTRRGDLLLQPTILAPGLQHSSPSHSRVSNREPRRQTE